MDGKITVPQEQLVIIIKIMDSMGIKGVGEYKELPDGDYFGYWSGYRIILQDREYQHINIQVDMGVRGRDIKCIVTVVQGLITVK